MEVDKCPVNIPGISQSAFILEAHFLKAPLGCDIVPLNDGIDSMQVIPGKCQGGETFDDRCSHSFVSVVGVAYDNAYFAASIGRVNM
jgi:hypothetical protein